MKKCIYDNVIKNQYGENVLTVAGYKNGNSEYSYHIFPCVGVRENDNKIKDNIKAVILMPIIARTILSDNDDRFIASMDRRVAASSAYLIKEMSMNIVTWNNDPVGFVCDLVGEDSKHYLSTRTHTVKISYSGSDVGFGCAGIHVILEHYRFEEKYNVQHLTNTILVCDDKGDNYEKVNTPMTYIDAK